MTRTSSKSARRNAVSSASSDTLNSPAAGPEKVTARRCEKREASTSAPARRKSCSGERATKAGFGSMAPSVVAVDLATGAALVGEPGSDVFRWTLANAGALPGLLTRRDVAVEQFRFISSPYFKPFLAGGGIVVMLAGTARVLGWIGQ